MKYFFTILVIIIITGYTAYSQSTHLWFDYFGYPVQDIAWDYELNIGYDYPLPAGGWSDLYLDNTVTYQKLNCLTFAASLELHFTTDLEYYSSVEIRPWLMTTVRWTSFIENIFQPYIAARIESRNILYKDEELNQHKFRLRLRAGTRFLINNTDMSVGTFYVPFRIEIFVDLGESATEKYAHRSRLMAGLGYVFSSAFRAEINYYINGSRNTLKENFTQTDQIFQLAFKHYF